MYDLYKTIETPSEGSYKEKGSKFLAFAYPISHEAAIKEQLAILQKQFHDARHYCYAWRLEPEKTRYRVNDDGEPSGTAGKPIYGQIVSRDLTDLLLGDLGELVSEAPLTGVGVLRRRCEEPELEAHLLQRAKPAGHDLAMVRGHRGRRLR